MPKFILRSLFGASLALLLSFAGCVDPGTGTGSVSGTALYVFDASASPSSGRIRVWDDASTVYASATAQPTRTISSTLLDSVQTLGWGGMCMDTTSNRMYLVSETGTVVRVERVRNQNGTLSSTNDIVSFTLGNGSADRLSSGTFGQTAFDSGSDTLYVTEANSSESRVWIITNPQLYGLNAVVSRQSIEVSGDTQGTGVAAWGGRVYGYFGGGNSVISADLTQYSGPRLRQGNSSGFGTTTLYPLIGPNTLLANYGALAFDTGNNQLFVARHLTDAAASGPPIIVFPLGQFTTGLNQVPQSSLGSGAGYNDLRILAHGGNKDWLAAATSDSGLAGTRLYLWQHPLTAQTPQTIDLSGVAIRGLAFDGYAS
jgi:hypothetical protein